MLRSVSARPRCSFLRAISIFLFLTTALLAQDKNTPAQKPPIKPDESASATGSLVQLNNALEGLGPRSLPQSYKFW
jgi:hypothetical protein